MPASDWSAARRRKSSPNRPSSGGGYRHAVHQGCPFAAEELLLEQSHADRGGACEAELDVIGLSLHVEAGPDADARQLAQHHGVMCRRRVLCQHRVEGLPRPERICWRLGGRVHVAAVRRRLVGAPHAERGEPVLRLKSVHVGEVRASVGEGAAEYQDPGGRRGLRLLDASGQLSLPARPGDGEISGVFPGRALPDVIDVVGGERHQPKVKYRSPMSGWDRTSGSVRSSQAREYSVSLFGQPPSR